MYIYIYRLNINLNTVIGCGEGCRGITGDRLRSKANNLLTQLFRSEEAAFKLWLQQFARLEPHEDLVDFLHALLGFCEEDQEHSDDEMEPAPKSDKRSRKKSLFAMPEGVNGVIIGSIFKILLSRVAEMNFLELKNLVSPEPTHYTCKLIHMYVLQKIYCILRYITRPFNIDVESSMQI